MKQLHPKAVWLFFIQSILWLLFFYLMFSLVAIPALLGITDGNIAFLFNFWPPTLLLLIFIPIFSFFWAKLTYRFYKYGLTPEGIKIEKGVIWKRYITIPYGRIQNVDIYRGPLARILGLSDLQIQTAGYSYGKSRSTEGRLPGLSPKDAEALRDKLVKKIGSKSQGL
jgi:membrane protein YdbS with pleckstrin-like domain